MWRIKWVENQYRFTIKVHPLMYCSDITDVCFRRIIYAIRSRQSLWNYFTDFVRYFCSSEIPKRILCVVDF